MSQMTKQALANSLKSLLQKKTLNKITIKDIVDDCGVNRQTFYYHFQDVYDLVDWIFHHDFERLLKDYSDYTNWHQGCRRILDYMQENRSLVLNVYHAVNRVQLEDYLKSWLKPILSSIFLWNGWNTICRRINWVSWTSCFTVWTEVSLIRWENSKKQNRQKESGV